MPGLKVLQVGSSMPDDWGGIERYVAYLSPALETLGHTVSVACVPGSPLSQRVGVPVIPASVAGKYDLRGVGQFLRIFRRQQFDIVNTHFSPDYLVPAWAARLAGQKGMVLTRHLVLPIRASRVRAYSQLYDHFVGVSEAARAMLVQSGIEEGRTSSVRAGVPALNPNPIQDSRSAWRVGVFGRLVEEKGLADLFAALRICTSSVECHVFGRGPSENQLKAQANDLPVTFHGYVSDIDTAMQSMDVIVVPSRCEEALGLVVLEAMSIGKVVVAARVGGLPEVVRDQVNGVLVDTKSPEQLAHALDAVLTDDHLRAKLGAAALATYRSDYTPEAFARRTEDVYLRLVHR